MGLFAAAFLPADFLGAGFLAADFFDEGFLAADFLDAGFLAADFFDAGFRAAGFFAARVVPPRGAPVPLVDRLRDDDRFAAGLMLASSWCGAPVAKSVPVVTETAQ